VARLGDRLLAVILDGFLIMAVYALLGMAVASRWGGVIKSGFSMTGTPALIALGLTAVFSFFYYWFFEGLLGATLGKFLMGIRVHNLSGDRCSLSQSFVRNLLRIIDGIALYLVGFLIAVFSRHRQRLGDHLAKTVVLESAPPAVLKVFMVLFWLAAIGSSLWGAYMIYRGTSLVPPPATTSKPIESTPLPTEPGKPTGSLQVIDFQFTEGEKGPVRPDRPYKPKDRIFSQYHIAGFSKDDLGQVHLEGQVTVSDPENIAAFKGSFTIKEKLSGNDPARGWVNLSLPIYAPPGPYKIRINIRDTLKNSEIQYITTFQVEAAVPVEAKELELRDILLSLSEEGPPVSNPVIRTGEKVYTSAKLVGMQFKENAAHLKIAYKLLGPRGELLLNKPDFLEVKDSWDYRPVGFYIPITANVSPPPGKKGAFTQQFQVIDLYGHTSRTYTTKFEVR
jgi:uncharacterized RDD family membrane protein YckC